MRRALVGIQGNVPAQEVSTDDDAVWTGRCPVIVKPLMPGQRGEPRRRPGVGQGRCQRGPPALPERVGDHEEFIEGPEVSVNGYLVDGRLVFLAVSDRETWPEFVGLIASHVAPGDAADDDVRSAIHRSSRRPAQRLGITDGPLYAQMMVRDGQPYIIEITPRLDGCHMWKVLREATGVDLMDWTLRHLVDGSAPHRTERLINPSMAPVRLEFHCQPPQTVYRSADHATAADATERYEL
ncbi:ATP-grasp domain-containing protein [Rhodococcus hoagii]|nr:ATP-grasp domain-containing protein [Prescottella equi]